MSKFFILTIGRSGSTFLRHMLHQHPDIHCDGELFNRGHSAYNDFIDTKKNALQQVNLLHKKNSIVQKTYGFKLITGQVQQFEEYRHPSEFIEQLVADGWLPIISSREDIFAQTISALIGKQTGVYNSMKPVTRSLVYIEPNDFRNCYEDYYRQRKILMKAYEEHGGLFISYEAALKEPQGVQATASMIFTYLGVSDWSIDFSKTTVKLSSGALHKDFANYDEIWENYEQLKQQVGVS